MIVLGCDLSLRSTGLVALPADWNCDWTRVAVAAAGYPLSQDASVRESMQRLMDIREDIIEFAQQHQATHAMVLGYAFNKADTSRLAAAGELGGIVKVALLEASLDVGVVVESRARTLLGKAPRKDAKVWATQRLLAAGAPKAWLLDQFDAFVAANWGVSELGGKALIIRDQAEMFV